MKRQWKKMMLLQLKEFLSRILLLVNKAFAYCFKEARLSATGSSGLDLVKHVGQVSIISRALTSKDGDLLSQFDKTDESQDEIENTSSHHLLINNHNVSANKSKIKGQLVLELIFEFCWPFKKVTKQVGFHLTFKTADLRDIFYTTLGGDTKVIFGKTIFIVPIFIPDAQTQIMFHNSIENSFTLSLESWSTDRKTVDIQLEHQFGIGRAQKSKSPNYLIVAQQAATRIGVLIKANNVAVFDNLNMRNYHVDIDGMRYTRDGISFDYALNDYVDQYRYLPLFHREYLSEQLFSPLYKFSSYEG